VKRTAGEKDRLAGKNRLAGEDSPSYGLCRLEKKKGRAFVVEEEKRSTQMENHEQRNFFNKFFFKVKYRTPKGSYFIPP